MPRGAAKRPRLKRADREASLIAAASKIVAERGVEALTMEGLAAEAGINKALPYRFFANRDAVLLALWDHETAAFDARVEQELVGKESLEAKLHAILGVWLDRVDEGGGILGRLEAPGVGPPELERRRRERTAGILEYFAGLFREEYRITRQEAVTAAAVLGSGAPGLAALRAHTGWPRKRLANTFIRLCVGALDEIGR
ncbi:MAG: TetR/AcrR family transcriptional regulator [Myxococcota bacterium]|nr:TetR/AcrR family transcriptional regulator [Myxococcota bacterium]